MTDRSDKPKIIIDEDWKTQVERERESARIEPKEASAQDSAGEPADAEFQLPPASFEFLITSLATQTMAALGQIPDPMTNEAKVSLTYARLQIDLLRMLQDKTKGNLTPPESEMLETALHQLRLLYVSVQDHVSPSS